MNFSPVIALIGLISCAKCFGDDVPPAYQVPIEELRLVRCDSEETEAENGKAINALDAKESTFWISRWKSNPASYPHEIVIAMEKAKTLCGVEIFARNAVNDAPAKAMVSLSQDGKIWRQVFDGNLAEQQRQTLRFAPTPGNRWLKIQFPTARHPSKYLALSEIRPLTTEAPPLRLDQSKGENRKIEAWLKAGGKSPNGTELGVNSLYWTRNDKPWTPVMGEFHFYRFPSSLWETELRKMKAGGVSIVSSYIFWEAAEEPRGTWNWNGDNDLRCFVELAQKAGLYVWIRPGPYVNGEIRHKGIPTWANQLGGRSDDPRYLAEVKTYFAQIAQQLKGLWFEDGGPIIGCQLENEYAHGSKDHLVSLRKIAVETGFKVPFYSATANSEYRYERGDVLPLQGAYPYRYWTSPGPTNDFLYTTDEWGAMENLGRLYYDFEKYPRGMCELGGGCLNGDKWRFIVPAYDMEGSLQNVIGRGINLPGYYMYHGGTHPPGMKDSGAGIPQNFDYQAPLGEFGQRRAHYHTLKLLHHFLNDYGHLLGPMQPVRPINIGRDPKNVTQPRYVGRFKDDRGFLFFTTCQPYVEHDAVPGVSIELKLSRGEMKVPAKPITLPKDCSPVFPVNFDLGGTNLNFATAQLMSRIETESGTCHIFFAHDGIQPDFCFPASAHLSTDAPRSQEKDGIHIRPQPSRRVAITATHANGKSTHVILLSRRDAEHSWRMPFRGKERLILSEADLLQQQDQLELASYHPEMSISILPAILDPINGVPPSREGAFSTFILHTTPVNLQTTASTLPSKTWKTSIPAIPDNVRDILVQANYSGSTADLFTDGKLYTDNRHIGFPFEFSFRRFVDFGTKEITLTANPWDRNVHGIPKEFEPNGPEEEQGMIRSVNLLPEYRILIR